MSPNPVCNTWAAIVEPGEAVLQDLTPEDAHRARLLHIMGLHLSAAGTLFTATALLFWLHPAFPAPPWTDLLLDALVILAGPLTVWFVRSSRLRCAAWTVLSLLLVGSALRLFVEGQPVTDIAARPSLLLTVVLAIVLLERRGAWLVLGASVVILVSMHALWWGGYLPPPASRDRLSQLLFSITGWIVLAIILAAILHSTMRALRDQARTLQERVRELTLLHEISKQITRQLDLDTLLETAVQSLHHRFGYHSAVILTLDEERETLTVRAVASSFARIPPHGHTQALDEGLIGWAARQVETVLVNDVAADARYVNRYPEQIHTRSELCVPIRIGKDVAGVLDVQSDRLGAFDNSDVLVLETLAGQIAGAMENARLYQAERAAHQQVRELATHLQNAREEERAHIARELLEEFGQLMTAVQLDLSWLISGLPSDQPRLADKANSTSDLIDESLKLVRRLSSQLRPSVLDHFGLAAAIKWQAEAFSEQSGIPHRLHLDGPADLLDRELSTALFRILEESLINVERHAEATEVHIELWTDPDQATLVVADDGRGIVPEEMSGPGSLGLAGMRQRAQALDGEVTVERLSGQGTRVIASIPRTRPGSRNQP